MSEYQYTVGDLLDEHAAMFELSDIVYGHGTDNAWDEAANLVLTLADLPDHESSFDVPVSDAVRDRIEALAQRRVSERIPLAYLLGTARFCGLTFEIRPGVLIPRSPIAELINNGFSPWLRKPPSRVLDLACGSGCIGIAIARQFPHATVVCSDISPDALELARRNAFKLGVADRVQVVESDLFAGLEGRFDLIVSNPPYVDAVEMANRPAEYRHEPELALASGADGLDFTRQLLAQVTGYLTDDGSLFVEVGASDEALQAACPELPFTWLEFAFGGYGVFLLEAAQLASHTAALSRLGDGA